MTEFRMWDGGYDGPELDVPDETIHRVFERGAAAWPDRVAIEFGDVAVTYRGLNARANRLAAHLRDRGVTPGSFVGVHVLRGPEMMVAVLGIGKAGAAYVMLDPEHPTARLRAAVQDADVSLVITDRDGATSGTWSGADRVLRLDLEAERIAAHPDTDVSGAVSGPWPACVMFTSGSTGRPKGALASHRALSSWFQRPTFVDLDPPPVWLQHSSVSWDVFAMELFTALLHGGRCVLQPGQKPDPAVIAELVVRHGVDTMWLSSGLFAVMLDEYPEALGALRQVVFGGESASRSHVLAAVERFPELRLVHAYGGVETALVETYHVVGAPDQDRWPIPIGRPETNTRARVFGERLTPPDPGEAGEIYVGGPGMVDGYVAQPALTAERFVADPTGHGRRLYRTGDLVRTEPDGSKVLLGRTDEQVKIRGFRVELPEIESILAQHPGVRQAVVVVRQAPSGADRLIAYVIPAQQDVLERDLLDHVRQELPDHSVADQVVLVDALPLTPHGKVDRAALPALVPRGGGEGTAREPTDEYERVLLELFAATLKIDHVGPEDNFFSLGGDSLAGARLVNRLRTRFGAEINHTTLFEAPTVVELAPRLAAARRSTPRPALTRVRRERGGGSGG